MSTLTYRRFPAELSGDLPSADTAAWARARALGFLEDATSSATIGPARGWAAEGRVLHGLFADSTEALEREDAGPVATAATLEGRLDVGHGCDLPTVLVADVAVRMGHEGQGLMRVLMDHVSASAMAEGAAVMALHAAHSAIYERLGYAPATRSARVDVDVARFALRDRVAGRVCEVDPSRAADIERQVRGRGPARLGALGSSLGAGSPDADVRHIVHEAPNGSVDALLSFRFRGWSAEASVIEVVHDLGRLEGRGAQWQSDASTRIATTNRRPETP
jgi:hypothetical protein